MTYQIAPVASEALTDWLGAKTVAIAYDPTQSYTVTVSKAAEELARKGRASTSPPTRRCKPGKNDYTDVVDKLAADKPDVIYAAVYFPEGGLIAKEMQEGGVEAQCVADYASYDTGFVETAGVAAARACPVVGVPAPEDFDGSAALRRANTASASAKTPAPGAPTPTTRSNFLADGIEKAGGTDAGKLEKALDAVKGWKGWTGSVTIDPKNGNRQPATVVIVDTDAQGQAPRRRGLGQGRRRPVLAAVQGAISP